MRLVAALLPALASGCSTLPVDKRRQGHRAGAADPMAAEPGCLQRAAQAPGQTRNTPAADCNDPAGRALVMLPLSGGGAKATIFSGGGAKATIFSGEALFYRPQPTPMRGRPAAR